MKDVFDRAEYRNTAVSRDSAEPKVKDRCDLQGLFVSTIGIAQAMTKIGMAGQTPSSSTCPDDHNAFGLKER